MPQDQLFKTLLQEFFREFIELFYPHIIDRLDFDRIVFLDKETFTDFPAGQRREADIAAQIPLRDGGQSEIVLIHIEVQATRRSVFPKRMFDYYALFRLRYDLPVYPIVVYLTPGAGGLTSEEYVEELFDDELLRFRYKAVGLPDLSAESYVAVANPLGPALSSLMQAGREVSRAQRKANLLNQQAIIELSDARRTLLLTVIEENMKLDAAQQTEFDQLLEEPEYQEVRQMINPYELRGIEKGRQQGIQQGVQQGVLQGWRTAALRMIQARFGEVTPAAQSHVASLESQEGLEQFVSRIATADSLAAAGIPSN